MSNREINIHLKSNQYFEIQRFIHLSDYFIVKGGRGVGKSYSTYQMALEDLYKELRPFVYCRLKSDEFKGVINSLTEITTPRKILEECGIAFSDIKEPYYSRGNPAKTISVSYICEDEKDLKHFVICYLCDVQTYGSYKGFACDLNHAPKWFIFDEFTNEINIFSGDVEFRTLDLMETFFRERDGKFIMITNNNNENNAFNNLFIDAVTIKITKDKLKRSNNEQYNEYADGHTANYNMKNCKLLKYYYITSRDIVGLYSHDKLNTLIMKHEKFDEVKHAAIKDTSIFDVDCQFLEPWCQHIFRIAKNKHFKLYE